MKSKKLKNAALTIIMFALMFGALYLMFKNEYREILNQLGNTRIQGIFLILLLGTGYSCLDGVLLSMVAKNRCAGYNIWQGIKNLYYGIFFKGITMATGTKPAQVYLMTKQGIPAGAAVSVITVQYVIHKFTVMLYTGIMLLLQSGFLKGTYKEYFSYLYLACGVNMVIIILLILACVSRKFHDFLFWILNRVFRNEKYDEKKENIRKSLTMLKEEADLLLHQKTLALKMIIVNILKLSCWYIIPYIAFLSVGETVTEGAFIELLAVGAFMNLVVGVLPVPGGNGSSELVYFMLFGVLFTKVGTGATMILYRLATYFVPFIIGCFFMIGIKIFTHINSKEEAVYEENNII